MNGQLLALNQRIEDVHSTLELDRSILIRLDQIELRLDSVEARVRFLESGMNDIQQSYSNLSANVRQLHADILLQSANQFETEQRLSFLENAFTQIQVLATEGNLLKSAVLTMKARLDSVIAQSQATADKQYDMEFQVAGLAHFTVSQISEIQQRQSDLVRLTDFLTAQTADLYRNQGCSDTLVLSRNDLIQADRCGDGPASLECGSVPYFAVQFDTVFASAPVIAAVTGFVANTIGFNGHTSDRDFSFTGEITTLGMNVYCGSSAINSSNVSPSSCSWMAIGTRAQSICQR